MAQMIITPEETAVRLAIHPLPCRAGSRRRHSRRNLLYIKNKSGDRGVPGPRGGQGDHLRSSHSRAPFAVRLLSMLENVRPLTG
jgi:hypothetical protein